MEEILNLAGVIENDLVREWKGRGGKVVGHACVATPVEVLEAAGLLPYRIRALGSGQTDIADAHLSRFNCSFCRACLQLGLDGTYAFLDGLVESNGCDHIRGMFENWQYSNPSAFFHYIKIPHVTTDDSLAYFTDQIRLFAKAVGDHYGKAVDESSLRKAMAAQDRIREKLRRLYQLRESKTPALTGTEALKLFLVGSSCAAAEFSALLDRFFDWCEGRKITGFRARLMLGGSATDEIDFVEMIEQVGGLVVTDALCYGSRAFWDRRPSDESDPFRALAEIYMRNLPCPRMFEEFPARREYFFRAVERSGAQGVILVNNKFCDVHGVDNVQIRLALEKKGVPVLSLEKEYGAKADMGRMKTRVQAFLERIGER